MNKNSQSFYESKTSPVFWFFLFISLPIILAILAFASGYRVDSVSGGLVENGLVHIDANVQTEISINGEVVSRELPFIRVLEPSSYSIVLQRDGFYPWEKEVVVEKGKSNVYVDTLLIQQSEFAEFVDTKTSTNTEQFDILSRSQWDYYRSLGWRDPQNLEYAFAENAVVIRDSQSGVSYIQPSLSDHDRSTRIDGIVRAVHSNAFGNTILQTDTELFLYQSQTHTLQTIIRSTEEISSSTTFEEYPYLVYSNSAGTFVAEYIDPEPQIWKISDKTCDDMSVNQKRLQCWNREGAYVMELW